MASGTNPQKASTKNNEPRTELRMATIFLAGATGNAK
jgi:hypothetical protein